MHGVRVHVSPVYTATAPLGVQPRVDKVVAVGQSAAPRLTGNVDHCLLIISSRGGMVVCSHRGARKAMSWQVCEGSGNIGADE